MAQDAELGELLRAFKEYNETLKTTIGSGGKTQSSGNEPEKVVEKVATTFDKSTTKIVAALGVLNSSVLASSKTEVAKKRDLEKFIKKVDETTDAAEKLSESLAKTKTAAQEAVEKSKKADGEKVKLQKREEEAQKKREEDAEKSRKDVSEQLDKFGIKTIRTVDSVNIFGDAAAVAAKALEDYMGALYKGNRGMALAVKPATEVLGTLVDGAKTAFQVFTLFTPWGKTIKAVTIGLTELVGWLGKRALKAVDASAEQLDALYKAYGELSASGAGAAGGLEAVRSQAQSLGFTMAELEDYTKLVSANSKSIKMFGGTVADGTKTLANMFQKVYNSEFGTELENMGIFQKEQRENALAYMEIQARTGNLQKANAKSLVEFNRQLDLSAAMTGAAREEAKQAELASKADPRLQAARRVAVEKDDKQEVARIDAVTKAAKLLEMIGDKGAATGARQFGAGGYAGGQAAIEAARQYGINNLKGGETEAEIMKMMRDASVENRRLFDNITRFTGPIAGVQTADAERAGLVEKTAGAEQAIKEGKAKDYAGFYEQEQKNRAKPPDVDKMNALRRTQQETAMMMDNSVNILSGVATAFADATTTFAKAVADFAPGSSNGKSWNKGGYSPSSGGGSTGSQSSAPPTPAAVMKKGLAETSNNAVNNEVKSGRIGKNEASAILEGGSKRDIEAFGGREALEKIVNGKSSGSPMVTGMASDLSKLFSFGSQSGSEENFKKLDGAFKEKVIAAATEYNNLTGKKLTVNSAWRSIEDQERLYNNKKPGQTVAKPGTSRHERGLAVDIQESSDPVLQKIMNDLGVNHGYGNGNKNVTHFQARNGGIFKGPTTGYNVELHGEEAVVPMNGGNNVTKQALPVGMGNDDRSGEMISLLQMLIGQNETVISLLDSNNDYSKKLVNAMS